MKNLITKESKLARKRVLFKKRYDADPEKYRKQAREWHLKNREKSLNY